MAEQADMGEVSRLRSEEDMSLNEALAWHFRMRGLGTSETATSMSLHTGAGVSPQNVNTYLRRAGVKHMAYLASLDENDPRDGD